ncbi:hypothetical protein Hanom_Chr04g00365171 [Helianthus anomalus]
MYSFRFFCSCRRSRGSKWPAHKLAFWGDNFCRDPRTSGLMLTLHRVVGENWRVDSSNSRPRVSSPSQHLCCINVYYQININPKTPYIYKVATFLFDHNNLVLYEMNNESIFRAANKAT